MERIRSAGFTLVEIMMVVAIMAILLAVAIPNMTGYRRSAEKEGCRDQMRSVLSAIEEARLERDYDVLNALRTDGTIGVLATGTDGGNHKNRYLPEAFGCPSGGAYSVSYDEDADTWSVSCPNASSRGHTL